MNLVDLKICRKDLKEEFKPKEINLVSYHKLLQLAVSLTIEFSRLIMYRYNSPLLMISRALRSGLILITWANNYFLILLMKKLKDCSQKVNWKIKRCLRLQQVQVKLTSFIDNQSPYRSLIRIFKSWLKEIV